MIKKPHLWKDSLHLNLSGKYQLMNNFCEKIKRWRSCDICLSATKSDEIFSSSSTHKFNGANSKKKKPIDT